MYYQPKDREENRLLVRREIGRTVLAALPFLAAGIAGFFVRSRMLAIAGLTGACFAVIFLTDLRILPLVRRGKFLGEVLSGLRHETAGRLMRIGGEAVFEDGMDFREIILNIYEDLSEEGERRFLMAYSLPVPDGLLGRDVRAVSHGAVLLELTALGEKEEHA